MNSFEIHHHDVNEVRFLDLAKGDVLFIKCGNETDTSGSKGATLKCEVVSIIDTDSAGMVGVKNAAIAKMPDGYFCFATFITKRNQWESTCAVPDMGYFKQKYGKNLHDDYSFLKK